MKLWARDTSRFCVTCGKEYRISRSRQRYCSANCRIKHFRLRQAERFKALVAENTALRQQIDTLLVSGGTHDP
jgi:hypothetical protein